jgi:hypothetical protein
MSSNGLFGVVNHYFWLLAIVISFVNAAIWWRRAQPQIEKSPQLEEGYRRLIRGWLIYSNIPWVVMGVGIVFGGIGGVFAYFNPSNGPFVIAWYVSIVILWILSSTWLFAMRGAEKLIEHPGLLNLPSQSPFVIKAFFLVCLAGGVIALTMIALGKLPAVSS